MAAGLEIVIFQDREKTLPASLPENLHSQGLRSRFASSVQDVLSGGDSTQNLIIVADGGKSPEAVSKISELLLSAKELHSFPLLFVGQDAGKYESTLVGKYIEAIAISSPFKTSDIIDALAFIAATYGSILAKGKAKAEKAKQETTSSEKKKLTTIQDEQLPAAFTEMYSAFEGIPDLVFDQLRKSGLLNRSLGGDVYAAAFDESSFQDKSYIPKSEACRPFLDQIANDTSKWTRGHLHRTAFLSYQIISALDVGDEMLATGKEASILFGVALVKGPKEYLRRDYSSSASRAFRKELCSRIKDSAMQVGMGAGLPAAGNILAKVARFIGGEESAGGEAQDLIASAIMGADLMDRVCARTGFFNPRLGYDFLQRAKSGFNHEIHPIVLCCLIKIVAEAITISAMKLSMPRNRDQRASAAAVLAEINSREISEDERRIAISHLAPGMRLSKPIQAFDGKEVLSEDLTLDEDLIYRIWQLSAVKPLSSPVIRTKDKS